jgi:hypothetical protein
MPLSVRSTARAVRIVAGGAKQFAITAQKTLRSPQTVGGVVDSNRLLSRGNISVEIDGEVAERFSGPIRKRIAVEPPDAVRYAAARRLEMALQTDLGLPVETETSGVQDGSTAYRVIFSGSMTALAVDTVGESAIRY